MRSIIPAVYTIALKFLLSLRKVQPYSLTNTYFREGTERKEPVTRFRIKIMTYSYTKHYFIVRWITCA